MSAKGIWIAFGVGVSAGAAVALLYAPQSGDRARKQLKRSVDDGLDSLEEAGEYLKHQAEALSKEAFKAVERAKGYVEDAVDKTTSAASSAAKSVQGLM